jgi:hypothetical protein
MGLIARLTNYLRAGIIIIDLIVSRKSQSRKSRKSYWQSRDFSSFLIGP